MLARTDFEFKTDVLSLDKIHIHSGYLPPSEGLIAEVMNPTITVSHSARIDWASKVMVAMLESTTHKSTGRLIYTVLSVQCPVSLSISFPIPSLLCLIPNLCRPLHHIAQTHINHWSVQLIFPPTCQEKEWQRHRPHPVSVYLCYYRRVYYEAFPFFLLVTEVSILSGKRLRMRCLSVLPARETKALEKTLTLSLTSCLRHLR